MRHCAAIFASLVALLSAASAHAQTAQRLSVQGSLLYHDVAGDSLFAIAGGVGFEAQLRYTFSAFSLGGGVQYTKHKDSQADIDGYEGDINLLGIFVEPRYTFYVGSDNVAPYVGARVAYAQLDLFNEFDDGETIEWTSPGVTLNLGAGLLVGLSPRLNLDVGASAGIVNYRTGDAESSVNGPYEVSLGSGTNYVLRLGLAFGLGK